MCDFAVLKTQYDYEKYKEHMLEIFAYATHILRYLC